MSIILHVYAFLVDADWVRVTCHEIYNYSDSDTSINCSKLDFLEGQRGYFIPGYSKAEVNLEAGTLSTGSGGGLLRDVGFNGGESTAFMRKTFAIAGNWRGWLPITVNVKLNYRFGGYSSAQLSVNLRSYEPGNMTSDNRTGIILRYHGPDYATLFHARTEGNLDIYPQGEITPGMIRLHYLLLTLFIVLGRVWIFMLTC